MPEHVLASMARGFVERLVTLQPFEVFVVASQFYTPALCGMEEKHFPSHAKFRASTPDEFDSVLTRLLQLVSKTVTVSLRHTT